MLEISLPRAVLGLLSGILATGCMTAWEIMLFRRYGLAGCLDWEINQHFLSRLNGRKPEANLLRGLVVHGVVGSAVGPVFACVTPFSSMLAIIGAAAIVGVGLWSALLPLRKVFTGQGPCEGPLGSLPMLASLVGHVIYGVVLGAAVAFGAATLGPGSTVRSFRFQGL